ncbi:MAG: cell wall hydrolase [Rhizobiaceae bacterium]
MRTSHLVSPCWQQRAKKFVFPLLAAGGMFFGFPNAIAFQDVASRDASNRWMAHIEEAPGETILASAFITGKTVQLSALDHTVTGSVSNIAEHTRPVKRSIQLGVKTERVPQKINRSLKGGRVVSITAKSAPVHFSAGSVLQRQSMLEGLNRSKKLELAFVKPKSHQEALKIASVFHSKNSAKSNINPNLPVMIAKLVKESESSVFAYAAEPELERSPFAAVLKTTAPLALLPKLSKDDHKWASGYLPKNAYSKRQQKCLAEGIYFEARGEPVRGQAAVAQVILNRVKNPAYPKSICGVVYQNKNWRNRCQFSFACDRIRDRVRNKKLWSVARHIATETSAGRIWFPQVGSSTHYHAIYVSPKWAKKMKKVGKIGLHVFYRTKNGGWS